MEILKGQVRDPGYPDCECTYAKMDDGQLYYFIKDGELPNQNIIATKILKEAIGHTSYTSLGLINFNGEILIPFENKAITRIGEDLLLVERNVPTTPSVLDAIKASSDPFSATSLVNTANTIKEQMKTVMGYSAEFIFDNQFSEAALYNIEGQNIGGGYFSFIGRDDLGNCYMSSNVLNSQIVKYDPNLVQNNPSNTSLETANVETEKQSEEPAAPLINNEAIPETGDTAPLETPATSIDPMVPNIDIPIQSQLPKEEEQKEDSSNVEQSLNEEVTLNIDNTANTPLEENNIESADDSQNNPSDFEVSEQALKEDSVEDDSGFDMEEQTPEDDDSDFDLEEEISKEDNSSSDEEEQIPEEDDSDLEEDDPDSYETDDDSEEEGGELSKDYDTGSSEDSYMSNETELEDITNPVILNATNAIRKLLDENRSQREKIDRQADELENLHSSNEILKIDNQSKEQELRSLRKSVSNFRSQVSNFSRENNKLKATNERQKDMIENLKMQNQALKEQVSGLSALGSAVAEANTIMGMEDSFSSGITYDTDLGYLGDSDEMEDSFQKKKVV